MKKLFALMIALLMLAAPVAAVAATLPGIRTERVLFAPAATSKVISGRLKGRETVDYLVRAAAGQTLTVLLKKSNPQNYFNINPPDEQIALFAGESGTDFKGILPADGDYTIRLYLMRAAARRNESSNYSLSISLTGKPLLPLPASKDALIRGTPFHASATITCKQYLFPNVQSCEAFVIRRSFDGTATVEVHWPEGMKRRILFVKGKPVASDALFPVTFIRKERLTEVSMGDDERYDIPNELIFGG